MKSGRIFPEKAINLDSPGSVCGYLVEEISWVEEIDSSWSQNCNFPGNDFKSEFSEAENCARVCKENPPCNHFVWTGVEVV